MIDPAPIAAVFAPLLIAASLVLFALAFFHVFFRAGFVFGHDLPRPAAYAVGLGVIGVAFTGLELFGRPDLVANWVPVLDFWLLAIAGAVPTLALRGVADNATLRRVNSMREDNR